MAGGDTRSKEEWHQWHAFFTMRRQLDRALERSLGGTELSGSEYEVLLALFSSPEHSVRLGDLSRLINWEKSRLSHLASRMERRGLVARVHCATDARGTNLELTRAGRRAVLAATRLYSGAIEQHFFDALSVEDRQRLTDISEQILHSLGLSGAVPPGELLPRETP